MSSRPCNDALGYSEKVFGAERAWPCIAEASLFALYLHFRRAVSARFFAIDKKGCTRLW